MQRSEYLALRSRFESESIRLVIVAESPPASGKYFYNPAGALSEPLFAALMQQLDFAPDTKESGLREFQRRGWVLVDATYEPVNALSGAVRDRVIMRDYFNLRDDLRALLPDHSVPLILLKANVCRLLEPQLTEDRFNVLNKGRAIYFPSHGRQLDFHRQFCEILKSVETFSDGSGAPTAQRDLEAENSLLADIKSFGKDIKSFGNDFISFSKDGVSFIKSFSKEIITMSKEIKSLVDEWRTDPSSSVRIYLNGRRLFPRGLIVDNDIADSYGLDRNAYRAGLYNQAKNDPRLSSHARNAPWRAFVGSDAYHAMIEVAERMSGGDPSDGSPP